MQTAIQPVAVYPATANTLYIRSIGLGPPPSYYYELQDVQVVAGTPAVGVEGEEGYVPAVADSTVVPTGYVTIQDSNGTTYKVCVLL